VHPRLTALVRSARATGLTLAIVTAVVLVSVVSIDLGPVLRSQAESFGRTWFDRGVHIGRLGVQIGQGRLVIEDLVIDGMYAGEDPWLVAKRVELTLTWRTLVDRELRIDAVEVRDWTMVLESYPNGRQTFPRVTGPPRPPRTGPSLITTSLQYIHLSNGALEFRDYGSQWSIATQKVDITVTQLADLRGRLSFAESTLWVQNYLPMRAALDGSFAVADGKVRFDRVELRTDEGVHALTGELDAAHWPEQTWQFESRMPLARIRHLFFQGYPLEMSGEARFRGQFHYFTGGRDLSGTVTADDATINRFRLRRLCGNLRWVPARLDVTDATGEFHGGRVAFSYAMAPMARVDVRPRATIAGTYDGVDLRNLTDALEVAGLRLEGAASGEARLSWPMSEFWKREGGGSLSVTGPPGVALQTAALPVDAIEEARARALEQGPFSSHTPRAPVPVAGRSTFRFNEHGITIEASALSTPDTHLEFSGTTAWGDDSRLPFSVTSRNWQASDRFMAGVLTAVGAPTAAVLVDGIGQYDGVLTGPLRRPKITGHLRGDEMRAWGVVWDEVDADFVVENSYATVSRSRVVHDDSAMDITGKFSLGYPRADGGEQMDARFRFDRRPLADFRDAFELEAYEVDGRLSGDLHLYGDYEGPYGFGRLALDEAVVYDEPIDHGDAALQFEGTGVRLDGMVIRKGGATSTGAAYVAWAGSYSFNVAGSGVAVESMVVPQFDVGPRFSGRFAFTASGSGDVDFPRYDVRFSIQDLFYGDEGVGEVTGRLGVRGIDMVYEFDAASVRLAVSGTGRVSLTDEMDCDISFRVTDTSLDPYLRAYDPTFSPYVSAVASGTVRAVGELYNLDALRVDVQGESLALTFFDYRLRNRGDVRISMDRQRLRLDAFSLAGDDTALDLTGTVDVPTQTLALAATGSANLAVLEGLVPDVRTTGRAELAARITGTVEAPSVSGQARLIDGRLRSFALPHALEGLTGLVTFTPTGVQLDRLTGRVAGGGIRFGGRLGLSGLALSEFDATVTATDMRLRVPEGTRSLVDAQLALQGPPSAPVLSGTLTVKDAVWSSEIDTTGGLFSGGGSGGAPAMPTVEGALTTASDSTIALDVRVVAASSLRIDNSQARIVASADLNVRGTSARPSVVGRADIERGEVRFEGRRYLVTRGSLDFTNPERLMPFFDVEAETRVRVPGQTYRVRLRMAGTTERLQPEFTSDPPLPPLDILTMLFSDITPSGDVELSAQQRPNEREQRLLEARATRALTGTLSAEVGKVVQDTFGIDSFQITPLLVDPYQQSARLNVNPSARITLGKRISDRIYLTYARSLTSSTRDEIILLEFDQSDTLAWILSQNEDRTYALEVRKRHTF
jgi:hypothetical protein